MKEINLENKNTIITNEYSQKELGNDKFLTHINFCHFCRKYRIRGCENIIYKI